MRTAAALVILAAALAGCGKGAGNEQNAAGNAGLSMPGPRPSSDTSSGETESGFRLSFRRGNIQSCIESANATAARAGRSLPAADLNAFCTCGIGRVMVGLSDEQLRQLRPGPREVAIREQCAADNRLAIDPEGLRSRASE